MIKAKCYNCDEPLGDNPIVTSPNRHLMSSPAQYKNSFCSDECRKITDKERYVYFGSIDRNASDSKCFIHDHWDEDSMGIKMRVGKCRITGDTVKVEPMQPGDNSGQPKECYEHFELR